MICILINSQIGNQLIRKAKDNEQTHENELPIQSCFCVDEAKNIHYPIISDASGMIWSDESQFP